MLVAGRRDFAGWRKEKKTGKGGMFTARGMVKMSPLSSDELLSGESDRCRLGAH